MVVRHDMSLMPTAPVVFLQYLAALAIVEGVKTYDTGFQDLPVRLKWPNDICMLHFSTNQTDAVSTNCFSM